MAPKTLLFLACVCSTLALQCLDDNGNGIDYWYILKPPADADSGSGVKYLYADASNSQWALSHHNLGDHSTGAVAKTLQQVYSNPTKYGFLFFNDEIPGGNTTFTLGHTKGVFAWDSDGTGFWMPHSSPKFPDECPGTYSGLAPGQQLFGQNFMCISISKPDQVGQVLQINEPYIYSANAGSNLASYPHLEKAFHNNFVTVPTGTSVSVSTQGGNQVLAFAKNGAWNNDLYKGLVAPTLKQDIYVECWCHPTLTDCYPSDCSDPYEVFRVRNLTVGPYWWVITQDHAKWALSKDGNTLCFGDINRHGSQKARGGGQYCLSNAIAGNLLHDITRYDECS